MQRASTALRWRGRLALVLIVGLLMAVFGTAAWIHPYDKEGQAYRMETHTQLGLAPCHFRMVLNRPCPTCGMTTSFALLVRGDLVNAWLANQAGVILALVCAVMIPWGIISLVRGRLLWIQSWDRALSWLVLGLLALVVFRWLAVVGINWAIS